MSDLPLPYALTAYGLPHVMGYLPTKDGLKISEPLDLVGLMDAARDLGLAGAEFDLQRARPPANRVTGTGESGYRFEDAKPLSPDDVRHRMAERGLRYVADYMALPDVEPGKIKDYLRAAAQAGAKVVRALISGILCGNRNALPEGWIARREAVVGRLKEALPLAEDLGLCIALENHQDATTDDMLWLADAVNHSPAFGVTLDTGNPLAVGEDPVQAASRLGPLIRHLHLKDYTIHFAPEGYRLVRCPAGSGVVNFPAILEIVRQNGYDVLSGIEIAAQPTRTIPVLNDAWWTSFPPQQREYFVPALRIVWEHGRPMDEPYSSPWERGADSETVAADEWDVVRRSVDYFRGLADG